MGQSETRIEPVFLNVENEALRERAVRDFRNMLFKPKVNDVPMFNTPRPIGSIRADLFVREMAGGIIR